MTVTSTTAMRGPMALRDWAQLLLLGAIWGGSFFFARIAVSEFHPLVLVLFRVAIAAAALQIYLALRGPSFLLALPHARLFFLLALANNVIPFSLIFAGQTELGAGLASVLNATTPFWTLIIANALTSDEKLSWNKLAGIVLGIAGTAVMIGPGLWAGLGGPVWAKFALVGASLSYAIALMIARRFKGVPPPVIATGQLTASTIIMVPVILLFHGSAGLFAASPPVWAAVFALALLSTAFAYNPLFQPRRLGWRDQYLAGHTCCSGKRHPARRHLSRRAAGTVRDGRHGADRARSGHYRWALVGARIGAPPHFFHKAPGTGLVNKFST